MTASIITVKGMTIHKRLDRHVLASLDGNQDHAKSLPLAQIEIVSMPNGTVDIDMPENLAEQEGLL
jgi:hypothetical protein